MVNVNGIMVSVLLWHVLIIQLHYVQCIHHYVYKMDQFVFFKLIAQIIQLKVHVILVVQPKFVHGLVLQ